MTRTPRFATRVYTVGEREYCDSQGVAAHQSYAARFAAKEAFLKAIKTGWRGKVTWHDIEILRDENGVPSLKITAEAKRLFDELGGKYIHLSLSHTTEHAIAQVIIEA